MNPLEFIHGMAAIALLLGLAFAFSNGFRDSSTIVASVVSTRALSPSPAFLLCSLFQFVGAMFIGSAVASTLQSSIFLGKLNTPTIDVPLVLIAALTAAILWGIFSWWRALPASNGHALFAGLVGAGWAMWGLGELQNRKLLTIVLVLVGSPLAGCLLSIIITSIIRWSGEWMTIRMKPIMESLHVFSCFCLACVCGSNGGQLALGALLPLVGLLPASRGPIPLRFMVALSLAIGVLFGGRRLLKKIGMQFYRIRNSQGLGAGVTSVGTILSCAWAGFPVSPTQVIAGSIVGAGVAKSPRMVRWQVVNEILLSWMVTLPLVAGLSFLMCHLLKALFR